MHIVQPYAKITNFMGLPPDCRPDLEAGQYDRVRPYGVEAVRFIEETGRKCYRAEGDQTADSYLRFIQSHVLGSRHTSMLRFSQVVVDMMIDRGIAQEVTRHGKTFDFQHESQRYCNYSKGKFGNSVGFIKPAGLTIDQAGTWSVAMKHAEQCYFLLLDQGCKPQIAADSLPRATASLLTIVGNFQAWRHFLLTRTTDACHPKLLDVTAEDRLIEQTTGEPVDENPLSFLQPSLLKQFQSVFPLIFDDIEPRGKHVENTQKVR